MAVDKKAKQMYYHFFDGIETGAANTISFLSEERNLRGGLPKEPIPADYAKAYREYWRKYGNFSPMWGWYFAARNGNLDVRYVPLTLLYSKIDQYFNSRKLGWGFNDKNYYSRIFAGVKQPKTVVRNFGHGIFTDEDYRQLSLQQALQYIAEQNEVICKPTQDSGSGRHIEFWKPESDMAKIEAYLRDENNEDYIVQEVLTQHPELEQVHPGSINTVRICSLLLDDGVHILSSCLRMGMDGSRVDNASAGGLSCGIKPDGSLDEYAYHYFTGEKSAVHPQGYVFKGHKIPSFDKAIELIKRIHPSIGHFRLVSWDVSIDRDAEPVLIEANMRKGGGKIHQFSNGPLFGDLTERVLAEVFNK